ncbi:hypothetical protein D3C85_1208320 [compost metagenome]
MSSSELWRVFRSLKAMPRSDRRRSSDGTPVFSAWASKAYSSSPPSFCKLRSHSASSGGMTVIGSCRFSVRVFLPSLRIRVAVFSTRISSPLRMTPTRSAISSASSI